MAWCTKVRHQMASYTRLAAIAGVLPVQAWSRSIYTFTRRKETWNACIVAFIIYPFCQGSTPEQGITTAAAAPALLIRSWTSAQRNVAKGTLT